MKEKKQLQRYVSRMDEYQTQLVLSFVETLFDLKDDEKEGE